MPKHLDRALEESGVLGVALLVVSLCQDTGLCQDIAMHPGALLLVRERMVKLDAEGFPKAIVLSDKLPILPAADGSVHVRAVVGIFELVKTLTLIAYVSRRSLQDAHPARVRFHTGVPMFAHDTTASTPLYTRGYIALLMRTLKRD
jgi:hypothetical protein